MEKIDINECAVWNIKDRLLIARNKKSKKWFYTLFCVDFTGVGEDKIELPTEIIVGAIPYKYKEEDFLNDFHLLFSDYIFYKPTNEQKKEFAEIVIRKECKRVQSEESIFGRDLKYWMGLYDNFTCRVVKSSHIVKNQEMHNNSYDLPFDLEDVKKDTMGVVGESKSPSQYKLRIEKHCHKSGGYTYVLEQDGGKAKYIDGKVRPTTENRLIMSAIVDAMNELGLYDKIEIECSNGYVVNTLDHNGKAKYYEKNSDLIQEFYKIVGEFNISYIFKYTKKPKVYLAGKITNNWWRNEVLGNEGCWESRTNGVDLVDHEVNDNLELYFDNEYEDELFVLTGPHSLGCDHGCYHDEKHSKHASSGCYWEYDPITKKDVKEACCHQIDKSDIVFAYIDSLDCYGTLAEIGYAYGKGKFICILYKNKTIEKELWFVSQMGNINYTDRKIKPCFKEAINEYWKHRVE